MKFSAERLTRLCFFWHGQMPSCGIILRTVDVTIFLHMRINVHLDKIPYRSSRNVIATTKVVYEIFANPSKFLHNEKFLFLKFYEFWSILEFANVCT